MSRRNPAEVLILFLMFALRAVPAADLFAYDPAAPLDVRVEQREKAGAVEVATISYSGARGRVSATLVTPAGAGKKPALVFMHDSGHKRDEFLAEAIGFARRAASPAVALLIDAPFARPPGWRRNFNTMIEGNDRDIQIQAVVDLRRGIDLLAARADVDRNRIGYVGHGQGANWGVILTSVEPRLRAAALVAGVPSVTELMTGDDPDWADMRFALGEQRFQSYVASLADLDPIRYAGHSAGARILLQFGRFDPFVTRVAAERLARAMGPGARRVFYDAGHEVNDPRALADRAGLFAAAAR